MATAYSISDRIIIMRHGQVVEGGDAKIVLDNPEQGQMQSDTTLLRRGVRQTLAFEKAWQEYTVTQNEPPKLLIMKTVLAFDGLPDTAVLMQVLCSGRVLQTVPVETVAAIDVGDRCTTALVRVLDDVPACS